MITKILTWFCTIISISGFAMYFLDKSNWWRFKHAPNWVLIVIASSCATVAIIIGVVEYQISKDPFSRKEKQAASSIMSDICLKLQVINNELNHLAKTNEKLQEVKSTLVNSPDYQKQKQDFYSYVDYRVNNMDTLQRSVSLSEQELEIISKTEIPIQDIRAFYNFAYPNSLTEIENIYKEISSQKEYFIEANWLDKPYELKFEMIQLSGQMLYYSVLELIADFPISVKNNFYLQYSPYLTHFPTVKQLTKSEAKSMGDRIYNKYSELVTEFASVIGDEEQNLKSFEQDLQRIETKVEINNLLKENLDVKKMQLKEAQESLRKKCELKEDDDQWLMWGKIIKLSTAKMYDDAIMSLAKFIDYNEGVDENVNLYSNSVKKYYSVLADLKNEKKEVKKINNVKLDTIGIVVVGFENNELHSSIKIGDILLFCNNQPIYDIDKYIEISKEVEEKKIKLYRMDEHDELQLLTVNINKSEPRIGISSLFE